MRGRLWVGAERGFSLIELIGVMAVMAILASMAVPPILRQVRQAQSGNEDANLNEVARAIVEGIKATGKIPNPNINPFDPRVGVDPGGWADVAYNYTTLTDDTAPGGGFAPGTLHYVFPSETAFAETSRRIYLDPAFLEYLDSQFNGVDPTKTFATPAGGWPATIAAYGRHPAVNFPNQAIRLYIVSSSRPDFALSCSANGPNVQVALNNYGNPAGAPLIDQLSSWVKATVSTTGFIQAPGAAVENWANNAHQYLHVKTVDLRPLFCQVTLINTAAPEIVGGFTSVLGNGYMPNLVIAVNVGNNVITFASDGAGNLPVQTASFSQISSYNARHDVIVATAIPPGTATYATPASPPDPTYDLYAIAGPGAGDFLPSPDPGAAALGLAVDHNQTQTFYVLKGQAINLFDGANALNRSVIIQSDVQYKYFNNSWNQVD
jgi:hypothetical protein